MRRMGVGLCGHDGKTMIGIKKGTPQHLAKIATGIEGFDSISAGGLPRGRISLLKGRPGSGKTVFALQALVNAARQRGEHFGSHSPRG